MNKLKTSGVLIVLLLLIFITCVAGQCGETVVNEVDKEQSKLQQEAQKQMIIKMDGLPEITNWTEAKTLKDIIEDRDDPKLICYWYMYNEYSGLLMYQGKCKGYGIPYSTQFSNPEKVVDMEGQIGVTWDGWALGTLPQAEPNGLFTASSSSATWVNAISEDGKTSQVEYVEPLIVVTKVKKPARLCDPKTLPDNYNDSKY